MAEAKLPSNRIGRSVRLAGLAGHTMAARAHTRAHTRRCGGAAEAEERARQERLAERYAEVLGDMKGAVMKVGQILSFVDADGVLPGPHRQLFQSTLARLQDDVPPLGADEVAAVIQAELGAAPEDIFDVFSAAPIAAASIGQVHYARLPDARELAVKVQYPGVGDAVRADLANTDLVASVIRAGLALSGSQATRLDPKLMVEEIRDRVGDELDYRIEAANQQEFYAFYDGHPFIHIPAVYAELSTRRVLATEFVRGLRWPEVTGAGDALRSRWGETMFRFVSASLHGHGLFNADPHPGNYLFRPDGTVTFLDFGSVKRFKAERVSEMSVLMDAALAGDAPGVLQAFINIGLLTAQDAQGLAGPVARVLPGHSARPQRPPTVHLYCRVGGGDRGPHLPALRPLVRRDPTTAHAQGPPVAEPHHDRSHFHTRAAPRHRRLEGHRLRDPPSRTAGHGVGLPGSRLGRPSRPHGWASPGHQAHSR